MVWLLMVKKHYHSSKPSYHHNKVSKKQQTNRYKSTRNSFREHYRMAEDLDTDAILQASQLINSTLISKGYINENLLFPTTNWDQLSDTKISINEKIYNNDKNLINIIYSLLQTIERNQTQKESFNKIIANNENEKKKLVKEISTLKNDNDEQLAKFQRFEKSCNVKNEKMKELERNNKKLNASLLKCKNLNKNLKVRYEVDVRKRDIQLHALKEKLLKNSQSAIIYNNNNSISPLSIPTINSKDLINLENEKILIDLTNLINNLIIENSNFLKFNKKIIDFQNYQNINLRNNEKMTFPINLLYIDKNKNSNINELIDEIESFDSIFETISMNFQTSFTLILNLLNDNSKHNDEIRKLHEELDNIRRNWEIALKTMENWKNYNSSNNIHIRNIDAVSD